MKRHLIAAMAVFVVAGATGGWVLASGFTGQHFYPTAAVEPAYNGQTGQQVFLRIPDKATIDKNAAWSPLYLVMYPPTSKVPMLDCQPTNCNHVEVLDWRLVTSHGLQSVYPKGTVKTTFGKFTGGMVKGHNHITTGDSQSVRHVYLVLFTRQGVADGAINRDLVTSDALLEAVARGDVLAPIDAGLAI